MKTWIGGVLVLAAWTTMASARIGETEAQIAARYGQTIGDVPTAVFGPTRGFLRPGYVVGVKFVHGISAMEMITKNDQSAMTPEEIATLLTIHGVAALWQRDTWNRPDWQRWRMQDGALV